MGPYPPRLNLQVLILIYQYNTRVILLSEFENMLYSVSEVIQIVSRLGTAPFP